MARLKAPVNASKFIIQDPTLPLAKVYFGSRSWDAKNIGIVIPPNESPDNFDWRFLKGTWVICRETGVSTPDYWRLLALCILESGAKMVHIFTNEREHCWSIGDKVVTDVRIGHEAYYGS